MSLVVQKRVRELAAEMGVRLSAEALQELEARVKVILMDAARRAQENGRKTIKAHDF